MFFNLNKEEKIKLNKAYKLLIEIRGSKSSPIERHIIDKRILFTKKLLSTRFGFKLFLLIIFLYRRTRLSIENSIYFYYKDKLFYKVVKPDYIFTLPKISIQALIKRIFIGVRIYIELKKFIRNNITDRALTVEFIWYLSALKTDNLLFNKNGIILNGDFSAKDAAVLAFVKDDIDINILMPLYWRFPDNYYYQLSKYANYFLISHKFDNVPKNLLNGCSVKFIKYKAKDFHISKTKSLIIGIYLTSFKGHEEKRFGIVKETLNDTFKKYGSDIKIILKPHPYELDIFLSNKELRKMNIEIAKDNEIIKKIDFFLVPRSTVIFEIILEGKPIILLKQIDAYQRFGFRGNKLIYEFFNEKVILPIYEKVDSCPEYKELINFYRKENNWKKIREFFVGN